MFDTQPWRPTHDDPLFILAMDHRDSFGTSLFDVTGDGPTEHQAARMRTAKSVIFDGIELARQELDHGRAGVLVDEQYGMSVIERAQKESLVLAIPIEASGRDWFTLQWGDAWLEHVDELRPDYAKVLIRDNPALPAPQRSAQLAQLAQAAEGLAKVGVALLYELIVPATPQQLSQVDGDVERFDRELRPDLVIAIIADNQDAGVEPAVWKVEGLETTDAACRIADQARAGGRTPDLIVLGRDAPAQRLDRWLRIAAGVEAFVGFAIGRSIWEDVIRDWTSNELTDRRAARRIADTYLGFANVWTNRAGG